MQSEKTSPVVGKGETQNKKGFEWGSGVKCIKRLEDYSKGNPTRDLSGSFGVDPFSPQKLISLEVVFVEQKVNIERPKPSMYD